MSEANVHGEAKPKTQKKNILKWLIKKIMEDDILNVSVMHERLIRLANEVGGLTSLKICKLATVIRGEVEADEVLNKEIEDGFDKLDEIIKVMEQECYAMRLAEAKAKLKREQIENERLIRLEVDTLNCMVILEPNRNDIYKMLSLFRLFNKSVPVDEVKKSYKAVIVKIHPDKNTCPSASEAFIKLSTEYKKYIANPTQYDFRLDESVKYSQTYNYYQESNPKPESKPYHQTYTGHRNNYYNDNSYRPKYKSNEPPKTKYTAANE